MPNTYAQLMYHVVFSTKNRQCTLPGDHRELLYRYNWGIHQNLRCHLYRIGGIDDHVHILASIPTTLSLADYVKELKTTSSRWLKGRAEFRRFEGWQDGYAAFTVTFSGKATLIDYIKGQAEHHRKEPLVDEYRRLLQESGLACDERYLL